METNTRPLRAAKGAFHLGSLAKQQGLTLCDFCANRGGECDRPATQEACGDLVPGLFFIPPHVGLDGRFSTFRPSELWYERARAVLRTHKTVALIESGTNVEIGRARLLDAVRGPFWALMEKHARSNHLMRDKNLTNAQAAQQLTRWIANNMGSRYAKDQDGICTVLFLERM